MHNALDKPVLIAGAGIAGLALALALAQRGFGSVILEKSAALGEVGAGLQLGPNAMQVLDQLGLKDAVLERACLPRSLQVRRLADGALLAQRPLNPQSQARYGQPYASILRADLQQCLWHAVQNTPQIQLYLNAAVQDAQLLGQTWDVQTTSGNFAGAALLACDGLWSRVRAKLWGALANVSPQAVPTQEVASRALLALDSSTDARFGQNIQLWMGPDVHVVTYPVAAGSMLNLVVVQHNSQAQLPQTQWLGEQLQNPAWQEALLAKGGADAALQAYLQNVAAWTQWPLYQCSPLQSAAQMASAANAALAPLALLGDAAHPMRPYFAQGAAMALEDALCMAKCAKAAQGQWALAAAQFAQARWQRNAKVQAKSLANARTMHARGLHATLRDAALRSPLGARLLQNDWLYAHKS